ncbi:MAG: hypothetical protein R3232_07090, partial [Clostridia bacterium]|nr:hypothetical protein [Clostridia bacterium]
DGSNRFREWMENLIAIPAKVFLWKRPPRYLKNMFYSFANVSMELNKTSRTPKKRLIRKDKPQYGLKGVDISKKPKKAVFHSRGVWMLGQVIKMMIDGHQIDEVIAYGIPHPGGKKFFELCSELFSYYGVKFTHFVVDGDWVTKRPAYGKTYCNRLHRLKNEDNFKGIKNIHLSYGHYLKKLEL